MLPTRIFPPKKYSVLHNTSQYYKILYSPVKNCAMWWHTNGISMNACRRSSVGGETFGIFRFCHFLKRFAYSLQRSGKRLQPEVKLFLGSFCNDFDFLWGEYVWRNNVIHCFAFEVSIRIPTRGDVASIESQCHLNTHYYIQYYVLLHQYYYM